MLLQSLWHDINALLLAYLLTCRRLSFCRRRRNSTKWLLWSLLVTVECQFHCQFNVNGKRRHALQQKLSEVSLGLFNPAVNCPQLKKVDRKCVRDVVTSYDLYVCSRVGDSRWVATPRTCLTQTAATLTRRVRRWVSSNRVSSVWPSSTTMIDWISVTWLINNVTWPAITTLRPMYASLSLC